MAQVTIRSIAVRRDISKIRSEIVWEDDGKADQQRRPPAAVKALWRRLPSAQIGQSAAETCRK